jgi:hypothetical protein
MNLLGPTGWVWLIVQSLTVFSLLTGLGLGLLAIAILLTRDRR